jgi:DNA adenine methylase
MVTKHQHTQNISSFLSPLRYPGSKRRLICYLKEVLALNNLKPSLYVEPFLGGASVALQLMQEDLVEKVILMDIDPWIASFWHTVFFDTAWLVEQIQTVEVTLDKWWEFKKSKPISTRDQALTCFFLNRTSFSGILEARAGPIGGKQQDSKYKIDCRFNRQVLIERIMEASLLKDKVYAVWDCSWIDGIQKIRELQDKKELSTKDVFFYLDPPFFEEANALYRYYFNSQDHEMLRDSLLELADKFILSYDSAEQVEALYGSALKNGTNGTHHHHVELLYSLAKISERKRGKEVIITNLMQLPKEEASSNDSHLTG